MQDIPLNDLLKHIFSTVFAQSFKYLFRIYKIFE